MLKLAGIFLILVLGSYEIGWAKALPAVSTPSAVPPSVQSLLKPKLYRRLVDDREILTSAQLDEGRYSYFVSMLVNSSLKQTRRVLTNYALYSQLISYVDRTDYSPITQVLDVQGGIWKFRLRSWVKFEERGERWIHYRIIQGHFAGLEGDMFFEPAEKKGTMVYFRGEQRGSKWPPKFVIERGAEIVFGLTARRMRNYLESNESEDGVHVREKNGSGKDFPQPRSRL